MKGWDMGSFRSGVLVIVLAAFLQACGGGRVVRLRMSDVGGGVSKWTGVGDPLEKQEVSYSAVNVPKYDSFLREAAEVKAGLIVANASIDGITRNIRNTLRSAEGEKALDENAEAAPLTDAELARLKSMKSKVSADKREYAVKSLANLVLIVAYLEKTVTTAKGLAPKAQELAGSVTKDFQGMDAVRIAPGLTSGLGAAGKNLGGAAAQIPEMIKRALTLKEALSSM
jgi:hypothetical protein